MDIISLVIDIVKAVGPTFKKYVKYQFCHQHYVHEFERTQNNLKSRLEDVDAKVEEQLQPGKIAGNDVNAWRQEARDETAIRVEHLICKGGCFTHICSSRKLDKKTQELNEGIFIRGEKYTNLGMSLVVDDQSIEYCTTVFKEKQEQLKSRQKDIEAKLKTQRMQPGKIASQEVEDWLKKASQQIPIRAEDLIPQRECPSSSNLRRKIEELKQILEEGEKYTNTGESLVVDDHSIEYCTTVFKEKQEQLKSRQKDIEAKLKTRLMQRDKIASREVKDWLKKASQQIHIKVEDMIPQGECHSSSNLRRKTEELKQILEEGEKYTNAGESLVIDDHSIEYCTTAFKEKQEQLKSRQKDIEAKLKTQLMQRDKIASWEVEDWLKKASQQIPIKVEDMIPQGECHSSSNLRRKTEELKQILEEGEKYTNACESLVVDDHSIKGVSLVVEECCGRDGIQEKILEWLKEDEVKRIAVCGMGGVGKTTIMKHVHNQLLKESKFDKVIWVKMSKDFDIIVQQKKEFDVLKFQKRIASSLELKLELEDHENETKVAGLISQKLGQGSFVLILDDVWESFSLEDVGIPNLVGNNGCKLLLTTRLHNVARAMDCKVIPVNPLPPDKALALFLKKVGSAVLSDDRIKRDIEPFLKQILRKCDGVPLAIVMVAKTMKGILDPRSWKWALSKLSKFEGIVDRLKFSYEFLESQCQKCFLYCALYPEDYEIPREELIEYWIEEGFIYKEGETRDAMNCEGHVILEKLVDNCLLDSVKNIFQGDCVSMHDLLREMALHICPHFLVKAGMGLEKLPEEHEWREDLLKVSLMDNYIKEIPSSMPSSKCPMLTTLLLSDKKISTIPETFFEHMLGLRILDLSNNFDLSRLPSSISKLVKLTTLLLGGCRSLREVPSLSNLGGLKKLDLLKTSIKELPQSLNILTNLKYLGLGGRLSEIPDGLLQNLSKLQYLEVDYSIPLKGKEIGRLGKLEYLNGRFSTMHDMRIFFNFRGKFLSMYGVGSYSGNYSIFLNNVKLKSIVCSDDDICGEPNWLPSDVQRLKIYRCKDVRSLNDIPGFQDATDLRFVDIQCCDGMKFVLSLSGLSRCNLEQLCLYGLDNLNAVFGEVGAVAKLAPLPTGTFSLLKRICVNRCNKMKKLLPIRWLWYLQNLETIEVNDCNQMEEIIWSKYEEGEKALEKVTLPKLQSLELMNLPQLKSIYSGSSTILICDYIKKIRIQNCKNLESVFWSGFNPLPTLEYLELVEIENLKFIFNEQALGLLPPLPPTIFFFLKEIKVSGGGQLKNVFSSGWLLSYFRFLQNIQVKDCDQMEELISSSACDEEKVTLPKLQSLELMNLPQLESIYSGFSTVLICDSIKKIRIQKCQNIKSVFWSGFNPLPSLEYLELVGIKNMKFLLDEKALGLSPPLPSTIFFFLKEIRVSGCDQLKNVFSSGWLLDYFQLLQNIQVKDCDQMEKLISSSVCEEEKVTLPKLQSLELTNLPQLKSIYSGSSTVLICDSIKKIRIQECKNIETVFGSGFNPLLTLEYLELGGIKNLKSMFDEEALGLSPPILPTTFFSLKTLKVERCHQLKKVFSSGWLFGYFQFLETVQIGWCSQMEELISSSTYEEEKEVTLPKLQSLELMNLPQMKNIYSSSNTILICDSIKKIQIQKCKNIESVFWSGFNLLLTLECLELGGIENLKLMFDEKALGLSPPPLPTIFFSLKTIRVERCHQLKKIFSSGWLLSYFQFLETIQIGWCLQMKELISSSAYEEEKVTLPKLQSLELTNLPQLNGIYRGSNTILICDSIRKIRIQKCKKIENVFWSGFCPLSTLEYLELGGIENLKLMFDEKALGLSPPLLPTFFFSLKTIKVERCHQLKKVFSSGWLLGHFQFLETIQIGCCLQMEELISSSTYKEEKVILPKLQSLELTKLPALKSICSSSSVLICDSIQSLRISNCKKLNRIPLNFPLLDNAQSSHPSSLKEIVVLPKEWWESLEWDLPNAKDILSPFCKFQFESDDSEEIEEEEL